MQNNLTEKEVLIYQPSLSFCLSSAFWVSGSPPRVGLLPWQAIAGFHAAGLTAAAALVMLKRPLRRRSVAKC